MLLLVVLYRGKPERYAYQCSHQKRRSNGKEDKTLLLYALQKLALDND
jgi:hypothetical protein